MNPPEKRGGEGVSPVTSVPSVPSVSSVGDNTDKRDRSDRGQYSLNSDSGFLEGKSEKERYAILLHDYPEGLTYQEAATLLNLHPDAVKRYSSRLNAKAGTEWVRPHGNSSPQKYVLTVFARAELQKRYLDYRRAASEGRNRALAVEQATVKYQDSMELPDQIEKFREFFELHENYMSVLLAQIAAGELWIEIEYNDLAKFCPELAEMLLSKPDEVLKAWQIAIEKLDPPREDHVDLSRMHVRIKRLNTTVRLSSLNVEHLNSLVQVEAQVLTVSERRPMMTSARFECPSCSNILFVLQLDQKFKEPSRCGCGRKGKFKMLSKELVPSCSVLLVQPLTELVGKKVKPSQLKVFLKGDLTRDDVRDHLGLNSMVRIVGVVHEVPVLLREGGQSTRFDLALEANSVELLDHYNPTIALSPERIAQIKKDVMEPRFTERMLKSFFPRHIGNDNLKMQLLCMSVAMPLHLHTPELRMQADCESIHIIVAGDPGMGKSKLGNRVLELAPHSGRATGAGASKAGLTIAADSKDKESDLVIPQPGALPSANMGIFLLDELDKMEINEQTVLNEALSEHTVTITKRGANTTLPSRVCFIGFANPRVKSWNLSSQGIQEELNIHYSLLTRCIITVQSDKVDDETDRAIARSVLNKQQHVLTDFDDQYIRDYLLYVRATVHPKLRAKDAQLIEDTYANLRKLLPIKAICPRFIEQFQSLSLLHAKIFLRQETNKEDVEFARDMLVDSLEKSGLADKKKIKVRHERFGALYAELYEYIRSQPNGALLLDLHGRYPEMDFQKMISDGELVESRSGYIRVNE